MLKLQQSQSARRSDLVHEDSALDGHPCPTLPRDCPRELGLRVAIKMPSPDRGTNADALRLRDKHRKTGMRIVPLLITLAFVPLLITPAHADPYRACALEYPIVAPGAGKSTAPP
jgi:hypothetical protein